MPRELSDDRLEDLLYGFSHPSLLAVCRVRRNEPLGERLEAAPEESEAVRLALIELRDRRATEGAIG
jgi:hypothetical protein